MFSQPDDIEAKTFGTDGGVVNGMIDSASSDRRATPLLKTKRPPRSGDAVLLRTN